MGLWFLKSSFGLPEIMAVLIGLSIWKLLQLAWLAGLFGGYPLARNVHLAMMFCTIAFRSAKSELFDALHVPGGCLVV